MNSTHGVLQSDELSDKIDLSILVKTGDFKMQSLNNLPVLKNGKVYKTCSAVVDKCYIPQQLNLLAGYDDSGLYFSRGNGISFDKFETVDYGRSFVKLSGYGLTIEFVASWQDCLVITGYAIIAGCQLVYGL
jgi:hypothetical protein